MPAGWGFEREFFSLAAVWLSCRYSLLHNPGDKVWFLLGELDYHAEMFLLIDSEKEKRLW